MFEHGTNHVFESQTQEEFLKLGKLLPCGPFEVLANIGHVSYELALPACIRVHNVFHVYLLKKYIPDANSFLY